MFDRPCEIFEFTDFDRSCVNPSHVCERDINVQDTISNDLNDENINKTCGRRRETRGVE